MLPKKWELLLYITTTLVLITVIWTVIDQLIHTVGLWTLCITVPLVLISLISYMWGWYTVIMDN